MTSEDPNPSPIAAGSILDRLTGRWAILLVVTAGCFAPLIVYNLDPLLRYRVQFNGDAHPHNPLVGLVSVLDTQASDQPATLFALLAPVAALLFVVVARTIRGARTAPSQRRWIGGWLAFFTLRETVGVVGNTHYLFSSRHTIAMSSTALLHIGRAVSPPIVLMSLAHYLLTASFILAAAFGIWLILRRDARAPAFWTIACGAFAVIVLFGRALDVWERTLGARVQITNFPPATPIWVTIAAIITNLCWCAYWIRSRRVRATFGRRGSDFFLQPYRSAKLAASQLAL